MRTHWGETAMGFVVLALAGLFLVYSLGVANAGSGVGGYELTAKFGDAGGLAPGAKVSLSGVKIGTVSSISLDSKNYLAVAHLAISGDIKLPSDSTANITSDGLLGGQHIVVSPGGAMDNLKPGDEIANTQGAVDLFGLIGSFLRPQSGDTKSAPAPAPAPAAPPAKGAAKAPAGSAPLGSLPPGAD